MANAAPRLQNVEIHIVHSHEALELLARKVGAAGIIGTRVAEGLPAAQCRLGRSPAHAESHPAIGQEVQLRSLFREVQGILVAHVRVMALVFSVRVPLQVPADLVWAACVGVRVRGVVPEVGDGAVQGGELGDLLLDLGQARVEEVSHVLAGRVAAVADVEDLADLGEGEACGLATVNEVDPGDGIEL